MQAGTAYIDEARRPDRPPGEAFTFSEMFAALFYVSEEELAEEAKLRRFCG
jgi:hypothetical protein